MIKDKVVIKMRISFSADVKLATYAHMYICKSAMGNNYSFVKCQRLKPYMLIHNPITNYIDEEADVTRNPFTSTTRIDCDKVFRTSGVTYSDDLITTARPDVCDELFGAIINLLSENGYRNVDLNENSLVSLNSKISFLPKDD